MSKNTEMIEKIHEFLLNIEDEELKEKYSKMILTLLEKGYFPGLAGIPVVKSRVSNIDGENGILRYRGYKVQELAEKCSYEDVCFLLLNEDLPLPEEREQLRKRFLNNKEIKENVAESIVSIDKDLHPMNMLSAGVLLLQSGDKNPMDIDDHKQNMRKSIKLIAKFPTILGIFRNKNVNFAGERDFNSFAEYCLYCFNSEIIQEDKCVDIFDKMLVLHADHTMNNSTFSARAVGSSRASIYSSISSAINSLSGPLHGGANERVIHMLKEIGSPENVEKYVDDKLESGEKIMGVGHRVYRTYDPRAIYIKENILPTIFENGDDLNTEVDNELKNLYEIAKELESVVLDRLSSKKVYPNVDFWSGLVLKAMGIEPQYFTTIFALGRVMGWCSHWVEHMEVSNKIYRPTQLYDGFEERELIISPKFFSD
ncbi:MAG: citrate/2-methylcitrate synthase [Bacillota bacterium]